MMGERGVPIVQAMVSLTIQMMAQHEGDFVCNHRACGCQFVTAEFVVVLFGPVDFMTVKVVTVDVLPLSL